MTSTFLDNLHFAYARDGLFLFSPKGGVCQDICMLYSFPNVLIMTHIAAPSTIDPNDHLK